MDVFSLRDRLVGEFRSYVRSFIHIADDQIRELVDSALDRGLLWPEPLIQLDPCFESGGTIDELVDEGVLHDECRAASGSSESETTRGARFACTATRPRPSASRAPARTGA